MLTQTEAYWSLFLETGQPVFYTLFSLLREQEEQEIGDQTDHCA